MLLGDLLIQKKMLTQKQLELALEEQKITKDFLGAILVRRNFIKEDDLMKVLSEQFEMPYVSLRPASVNWAVALKFSPALVNDHQCIPIREVAEGIVLAVSNPLDADAISMAEREAQGKPVNAVLALPAEIKLAVAEYNRQRASHVKKLFE